MKKAFFIVLFIIASFLSNAQFDNFRAGVIAGFSPNESILETAPLNAGIMTEFILPAELSAEMTEQVKWYAVKAFEVCGCSGVSRVDFLIVNNIPYILEINTNPGMTDTSDLPAQAAAGGISYDELVDMILHSVGLNK
jgi:predicted ATP-grasp superfamily ATP-dependent carboligase